MDVTAPQRDTREIPLLTVIVPVYNAMPYLVDFLDSLVDQDLDAEEYEVLLVNDGSTDDGPIVMDDYVARQSNFRVLHEANSGWPGTPRNTGLGIARTKYVFFADSDDIVQPTALRLMVELAEKYGSDIVIPQLVGMNGRKVPKIKVEGTSADLDLVAAFQTLGPIKLYRLAMLMEHGITFPTEKVRLEDGIFNAQAYLAARRISVLAGEELYRVRSRDDGQNISVQPFEPYGYTSSIVKMCRIVNAATLDESTRRSIVLGLFQRKCLKIYRPGRFDKYSNSRKREWVAAHRDFVDEFVTPGMEKYLRHPYDVRTHLVRRGDIDSLVRLQWLEPSPMIRAELASLKAIESALEVTLSIAIEGVLGVDQLACELRSREGNGHAAFSLRSTAGCRRTYATPHMFIGTLQADAVSGLVDGVYDMYVTRIVGKEHLSGRIGIVNGSLLGRGTQEISAFVTIRGNLSLKKTSRAINTRRHMPSLRRWISRRLRKSSTIVDGVPSGN